MTEDGKALREAIVPLLKWAARSTNHLSCPILGNMAEEEILEHHAEKELDHKDYTEKHHVKKHRKRAKSKSIHIQHINKHTNKIRKDKQKKKTERKELDHKAELYVHGGNLLSPNDLNKLKFNGYELRRVSLPIFWRLARSQPSLWVLSKPPEALPRILQHYL